MSVQPTIVKNNVAKPVKIVVAVILVLFTLFVIGAIKDVPVYEVRKEVSL